MRDARHGATAGRIVDALWHVPDDDYLTVSDLAVIVGITAGTAANHLTRLEHRGRVVRDRSHRPHRWRAARQGVET